MFNPLVDDFSKLSDQEIDEKIRSLSRIYYQTLNDNVREQVITLLDMYQLEIQTRRAKTYRDLQDNSDTDLDNLINVN